MHCGQVLARPATGPAGAYSAAPIPSPNAEAKKKAWIFALIGALAVLALFGGLFASGALRFGAKQEPMAVLPATGKAPPPALAATGKAPPPQLQVQGKKVYMPDDVRAWLEHLERIERKKVDITNKQFSEALTLLAPLMGGGGSLELLKGLTEEANGGESIESKNPATSTARSIEQLKADWTSLVAEFNSVVPPPECRSIRDEYDQHIREVAGSILDILGQFKNISDDPSKAIAELNRISKEHPKMLDNAGARADDLVSKICDKYDTRKWFKIDPDPAAGKGILGIKGF